MGNTVSRPVSSSRVVSVLASVLAPETVERVVLPTLADVDVEAVDAKIRGARRRCYVLLRGYGALVQALALVAVMTLGGRPMSRNEGPLGSVGATLLSVGVLAVTFFLIEASHMYDLSSWALLVPQALGIAIPVGVLFGVALGCASDVERALIWSRKRLLSLTALAMTASLILTLWLIPVANQAFRTSAASRATGRLVVPEKGPNEMTLVEIRKALSRREPNSRESQSLSRSSQIRFALPAACFVFTVAGLAIVSIAPRRVFLRVALSLCVAIGYGAVFMGGQKWAQSTTVSQTAAVWWPNILLLILAVATLGIVHTRRTYTETFKL